MDCRLQQFWQNKEGKNKYGKNMVIQFYFHPFQNIELSNFMLLPLNFVIPQISTAIKPHHFSQNPTNFNQNTQCPEEKLISRQLCPQKVQKKRQRQTTSNNIETAREKENKISFEQKKKTRMSREDVEEIDEEGNISIRIQWKNQNRNIIPNIMNQLLSYLTKPSKSKLIVTKILQKQSQNPTWTIKRYYNYLKIVKEQTLHYLDQYDLRKFFVIHSPQSEVYPLEEQQFYMKICRILIGYFLKNEVVLISATSTRMNSYNRKIHLIGREVLIKIFCQIAAEFRPKSMMALSV